MRLFARFASLAIAAGMVRPGLVQTARAADDPAAAQVDVFDKALLDAMKNAKSLGVQGRYRKLAPVVQRSFDLPTMTKYSVGPSWTTMSAADQRALIEAFTKLSVASYANNFNGYTGERFVLSPRVDTRGPDKMVQTQLIPTSGAAVNLVYRMRQAADGGWKIIDVYYGAISQLTTRRSDFAASLASGGAQGLIKHLASLTDKLLK